MRGANPSLGSSRLGTSHGRTLRRGPIGLALLCVPLLLAPTPGATGGCSCDEDPKQERLTTEAEVLEYCREREELVCVRAFERGETSILQRDDCRREAIEVCGRRTFPEGCAPTRRAADACLNALQARSTLDSPVEQLPECDLCAFVEQEPADGLDGGVP